MSVQLLFTNTCTVLTTNQTISQRLITRLRCSNKFVLLATEAKIKSHQQTIHTLRSEDNNHLKSNYILILILSSDRCSLPFPSLSFPFFHFLALRFALLFFALLCFAFLCFALLCFALLCFALLCFALLCLLRFLLF